MFIGEGPGFYEDRDGRPFVGPAGQFLEEMLGKIGLSRPDVYITNMIKCRPPENRDPQSGEIDACSSYLDQQIEMISPKVIVTLGRISFSKFFPGEAISKARGKPRGWRDLMGYPMFTIRRPRFTTPVLDRPSKMTSAICLASSSTPVSRIPRNLPRPGSFRCSSNADTCPNND